MSILDTPTYKKAVTDLAKARARVISIERLVESKKQAFKVKCAACKRQSKIGDMPALIRQEYRRSYAAYEDPYFNRRSDKELHIICPCCKSILVSKDEVVLSLEKSFGLVIDYFLPEHDSYIREPTFEYWVHRGKVTTTDMNQVLKDIKDSKK